jgi:hypothetical protein
VNNFAINVLCTIIKNIFKNIFEIERDEDNCVLFSVCFDTLEFDNQVCQHQT